MGDLVPRPRLIERLNEGLVSGRKLTLLSAPVGYGKTTTLSDWIPHSERCVAWVSLDEGEHDPVRFWAHVIAALQMLDEGIGRHTLALMRAPLLPSMEAILTSLLNEIAAFPDDFALVLDDYHRMDAKLIDEALFSNVELDEIIGCGYCRRSANRSCRAFTPVARRRVLCRRRIASA